MRVRATNYKTLNHQSPWFPAEQAALFLKAIVWMAGWVPWARAVIAPGSGSGVIQLSKVPAHVWRPLLPLLAARVRMVALERGHPELPWLKWPLSLGFLV